MRSDVERVTHLVRHDDGSDVFEIPQLDDFIIHGRRGRSDRAPLSVVKEQQRRPGGHRARDRNAAPLTARQLRRHSVSVITQTDEPENVLDPFADLAGGICISSDSR
jgi:hypothetical protein